jgi:hypothetical protein
MSKLKWVISSLFISLVLILFIFPWKDAIEKIIVDQIDQQGFGPSQLHVSSFGMTGINISNFSALDGGLRIKKIDIDWSIFELHYKRIKNLRVKGLDIDSIKLLQSRKSEEKRQEVLNYQSVIEKIPAEKFTVELLLPQSSSGFKFDRKSIVLSFEKKKKIFELWARESINIQHKSFDLVVRPFKLFIEVHKDQLVLTSQNINVDLKYYINEKREQFIALDKITLSNNSSISLTSTYDDFRVGAVALDLNSHKGIYGVKNVKWGKLVLSVRGQFDDLKIQGGMKNINHVASNCLDGLDLDFDGHKNDHISFQIQTPSHRKDLSLSISGKLKDKINFDLISKDLSAMNLKETSPCVGEYITDIKGNLRINGFIGLGKKRGQRVDIKLRDAGFKWDEMEVSGVELSSNIINFKTFAGVTPTKLNIKKIGLAFELNDFKVDYLIRQKQINIDQFNFSFLGGKFWSDKFILDRKTFYSKNFVLQMDNIPLDNVLKIGLKDTINASGELKGEMPIIWKGQIPFITHGKLETNSPGNLRYKPKTINPLVKSGNPNAKLLSNYLENLNYSKISIDVDSDEKYNLQMNANIFGVNPTVNKGRPLKFGLNLGLDVRDTIFSYIALMKIPKKLEQKFLKKLQK